MPAPKMTAKELLARLQRHYIKPGDTFPGGVLLPEVTFGRAGGKRADAIYVGFTSARGRNLVGHEIKVSRSDWMHELDQAGKSDPWADQCHAFYVVAPTVEIVRPEELPEGWGLLTAEGNTRTRLHTVVKATVHRDREPSWTAVHSVLQRQDTLRAQAIGQAQAKASEDAYGRAREIADREIERRKREAPDAEKLRETLKRIQDALGMRIVDEDRRYLHRDTEVAYPELEEVGQLIRQYRSVTKASDAIVGRYGSGKRAVIAARTALDDLDAALAALSGALPEHKEDAA